MFAFGTWSIWMILRVHWWYISFHSLLTKIISPFLQYLFKTNFHPFPHHHKHVFTFLNTKYCEHHNFHLEPNQYIIYLFYAHVRFYMLFCMHLCIRPCVHVCPRRPVRPLRTPLRGQRGAVASGTPVDGRVRGRRERTPRLASGISPQHRTSSNAASHFINTQKTFYLFVYSSIHSSIHSFIFFSPTFIIFAHFSQEQIPK